MTNIVEILKIADIHVARIEMALITLQKLMPFDAVKIETLTNENLLLTDLLVHRFGKLQDLIGSKIINEFLKELDEYSEKLSQIDKIYKLERLGILENVEVWKEIRTLRNHITHEYPDHPDFTANDLNKIVKLAPHLVAILNNIKQRLKT